jgi:hypothetical protein
MTDGIYMLDYNGILEMAPKKTPEIPPVVPNPTLQLTVTPEGVDRF